MHMSSLTTSLPDMYNYEIVASHFQT